MPLASEDKTMDLSKILKSVENCPCGKKHEVDLKAVEIGSGYLARTADILKDNGFKSKLLVVADKNTLKASEGILEVLENGGFKVKLKLYEILRTADMDEVDEIERLCGESDAVLSVGSGSLNDICRLGSFRADKPFAIFATAPSMDGFASDSAPITKNNFKMSYFCRQPSVIIADTKILAAAPAELKAAGFGDMIAKYIAIVDWKVAKLTIDEYYCENVLNVTREGLKRIVALADKITLNSEEAAGAVMEALVLTGIAMKFTKTSRPASGTEHVISHFWEIKKLERGIISDFHGKKVGVATLITNGIYHWLAAQRDMTFKKENLDWDEIYRAYGPNFKDDIVKMNTPTITEKTSPEKLAQVWDNICDIVETELPTQEQMLKLMKAAGAATTVEEIAVDPELALAGVKYHPYMRYRMTLMRLIPMMNTSVDFSQFIRYTI